MKDTPAGLGDSELSGALADGWQLDVAEALYAPVGGGSYHWVVRDGQDRQWFVTVDDLDVKPWLGDDRAAVFEGLQAAMELAFALRHRDGLRFVLAPTMGRNGLTVLRLGCKYAVTVFPYVDGTAGRFGEELPESDREQLVDMLAALHVSAPEAVQAPRARVALPRRRDLEAALREVGQPWSGSPFGEQARALLADSAGVIRRRLATFDKLAGHVSILDPVITHGEPHPANLIRTATETMLIDWDTVGAGPPERDLWWVVSESGDEAGRRYTEATGRPVGQDALAFYRLRWALDDLSIFADSLRGAHRRTPGTEHAWRALQITVANLTG